MSVTEQKKELRTTLTDQVKALDPTDRLLLDAQIAGRVTQLQEWRRSRIVLAYFAMNDEVDLDPLLRAARQDGKEIAIPRIAGSSRAMSLHLTGSDGAALERHPFGFLQPAADSPMVPPERYGEMIVIVPARGLDRRGNRLGRGGGYYDRLIAQIQGAAVTVGVVYACQLLRDVPVGSQDMAVDLIVTDRETCFCRNLTNGR